MKTVLALALVGVATANAQNVISSHSGLIHYVEGYGATIEGALMAPRSGEFPLMKDGETLSSEHARVEVLLNPGAFLRMDKDSSIKMVSTQLSDSRVEILTGSALIELDDLQKGNNLMLLFHGSKITPTSHGLYRINADQNRLRVIQGEVQVIRGDQTIRIKAGHELEFDAVLATGKFNRKANDILANWAESRSQRIAAANLTSANMVSRGGASSYTTSSWIWNASYGMFTFLPASGYGYNPYGWRFYSPQTIGYYYSPQQTANSTYAASNSSINGARSSLSNGSTATGSAVSSNASVGTAAAPTSAGVSSMGRGSVSGGGARGR